MAKEKKMAWFNWSRKDSAWVERLWIDEEWTFSKSFKVRDIDQESDNGWVHDSIMCEIAHLQDLGYEVKVTV